MDITRKVVTVAAAGLALALTGAATPASAGSDPLRTVDLGTEGSTVDLTNFMASKMSDVTSANASYTAGCVSVVQKPQLTADFTSPTGTKVFSHFAFSCAGISGGRNTYAIQRARWTGWQSLPPVMTVSVQGEGGLTEGSVGTPCRAGTWFYRAAVTGTNFHHSDSTEATCFDESDLFYIDQG